MKALFKRIWDFLKRVFHIVKKQAQIELEETKEQLAARLGQELKEIGEKLETAAEEEFEKLEARALNIRTQLLMMAQEASEEVIEELRQMRGAQSGEDLKD